MTGGSLGGRFRTAAGAALLAGLLSGCGNPVTWITGGNAIDDYCGDLRSHQVQFSEMFATSTPDALLKNLPMLEQMATKAPSDIADDWQNFLGPIQGLQKALDDAGIKADDFSKGVPPAGTSAAARKEIADAAALLATPAATTAAFAIDQEARDVCKLNLGM